MTQRAASMDHQRHDRHRRVLDVVVSLLLLVVLLPVIALCTIGSAVALRAWPFFTQKRVGLEGETFRFWKVRTLPRSCPRYTDKHRLDAVRIPTFCRLLRRLHLDELPQLLLVLRGHMSLVGPRPEMPHLHAAMAPSFAELRTSVRPGCTGFWQISEHRSELIEKAPEYDRFYIQNRSVTLDLWILGRTVVNMLGIERDLRLVDAPSWALRTEPRPMEIDLRDSRREVDHSDVIARRARQPQLERL